MMIIRRECENCKVDDDDDADNNKTDNINSNGMNKSEYK